MEIFAAYDWKPFQSCWCNSRCPCRKIQPFSHLFVLIETAASDGVKPGSARLWLEPNLFIIA
jgi:hypothetical protein